MTNTTSALTLVNNPIVEALDGLLNDRQTADSSNALDSFLTTAATAASKFDVYAALEYARKNTEDKSRKVRISEATAVYTANLNGFELDMSGYHAAVKSARTQLKDHKLLPNGNPKKDDDEVKEDSRKRFMAQAIKDGVNPADLGELWERECDRKDGVPVEDIEALAIEAMDNITSQGYDYVTVAKVVKAMSAIIASARKAEAEAKKAGTVQ